MTTSRQIEETISRCVSIMVYYHNSERSTKAQERMVAEVQLIACFVKEMGMGLGEADRQVLRPVESELILRYGPELGPRLIAQFIDAFESLGVLDS